MPKIKIAKMYIPFAVVTVFGMQSLRLLLPLFQQYLRDSVGISSLNLAPIALGVFALAFLPGLIVRRTGLRGALVITMTLIPLLRLVEQISRSSLFDLVLSGGMAVLFWWFLAAAFSVSAQSEEKREVFAVGLLLGLVMDTALHAAAGTLDLSWQSGYLPIGVVLLLTGWVFTVGAAWRESFAAGISDQARLHIPGRLIAFGVWLLLQMMLFQNVARFAAISGLSMPVSGVIVTACSAAALLAAVYRPLVSRHTAWITALALTGLLVFPAPGGAAAVVWLLVGHVLMGAWLAGISASVSGEAKSSAVFSNTFGPAAILYVLCGFLFYVSYDLPVGLSGPQFLPFFGGFLLLSGLLAARYTAQVGPNKLDLQPVQAAVLLILLPVGYWLSWQAPATQEPPVDGRQVRIMSYNLHQAFDTDGQLSIEALAQQIEASDADVIALQEVVRGYLTTGSFDMIGWLSHRLGMPYVFGPAGDVQWGNAVLSRYPILEADVQPLPPDDLLLLRGYIEAVIDIGQAEVTVIATHLHHRGGDGDVREQQVPVLLQAWAERPNTVILGDLNARPEDPEIQMIESAGLINASLLQTGKPVFTFHSTSPDRQIDYIWYTADLVGSDFSIAQTTASDHLPVVVTLTIP